MTITTYVYKIMQPFVNKKKLNILQTWFTFFSIIWHKVSYECRARKIWTHKVPEIFGLFIIKFSFEHPYCGLRNLILCKRANMLMFQGTRTTAPSILHSCVRQSSGPALSLVCVSYFIFDSRAWPIELLVHLNGLV